MTHGILLRVSAVALGVAAFASLSASSAHADAAGLAPQETTATPSISAQAPTPSWSPSAQANASDQSLGEPAPTPGWAESHQALAGAGTAETSDAARAPAPHRAVHRYYARSNGNPAVRVASGVVGGVADVGAVVAYPVYCFPNWGRCPVKVPYRF